MGQVGRNTKDSNNMRDGILSLLASILMALVVSVIVSFVFAGIGWIFGKPFLIPFIGGACGIFALYVLTILVKSIVTFARFKKDPIFKKAYFEVGLDWQEYKRIRNTVTPSSPEENNKILKD